MPPVYGTVNPAPTVGTPLAKVPVKVDEPQLSAVIIPGHIPPEVQVSAPLQIESVCPLTPGFNVVQVVPFQYNS